MKPLIKGKVYVLYIIGNFGNFEKNNYALKTLTIPNPQKISKGHFFGKIQHCTDTCTFTSSNGVKLLPGKKYRP